MYCKKLQVTHNFGHSAFAPLLWACGIALKLEGNLPWHACQHEGSLRIAPGSKRASCVLRYWRSLWHSHADIQTPHSRPPGLAALFFLPPIFKAACLTITILPTSWIWLNTWHAFWVSSKIAVSAFGGIRSLFLRLNPKRIFFSHCLHPDAFHCPASSHPYSTPSHISESGIWQKGSMTATCNPVIFTAGRSCWRRYKASGPTEPTWELLWASLQLSCSCWVGCWGRSWAFIYFVVSTGSVNRQVRLQSWCEIKHYRIRQGLFLLLSMRARIRT